jgi:hypothetical protein
MNGVGHSILKFLNVHQVPVVRYVVLNFSNIWQLFIVALLFKSKALMTFGRNKQFE